LQLPPQTATPQPPLIAASFASKVITISSILILLYLPRLAFNTCEAIFMPKKSAN
jgi:hypothetical protein